MKHLLGVTSITAVTMRERTMAITSSAIRIPRQFFCEGLFPTSSCRQRWKESFYQTRSMKTKGVKGLPVYHPGDLYVSVVQNCPRQTQLFQICVLQRKGQGKFLQQNVQFLLQHECFFFLSSIMEDNPICNCARQKQSQVFDIMTNN